MTRFGIEEEFVLLDEDTLVPLALDRDMRERLAGPLDAGAITPEYLTSQIETATAPLSTVAHATTQLTALRAAVAEHASGRRAIVAATGTPFLASPYTEVFPVPHYHAVAEILGEITRGHEVNGLHVHVEVLADEERVRAVNRARAWMPVLLALSGNSPFSRGRDTGFASWRSILVRRLPTSWTPPLFPDYADYRARVDEQLALGGITEESSVGWTIRLSARFPTIEVRVCDTQLDVDDAVLCAILCRAIATSTDLDGGPEISTAAIDASLWTAARYGRDARVVDPTTGDAVPVVDVLDRMLSRIAPALSAHDDADFVSEHVARLLREGGGAQRQRSVLEQQGVAGLRDLYRATTAPKGSPRQ